MSRKYKAPEPTARYDKDASETLKVDDPSPEERFGRSATLYGEMIGMSPEELLEHAKTRLGDLTGQFDKLAKHLPRRLDKRVDALREPAHDVERAIQAVEVILANIRAPLAPAPERPEDAS